MKKEIKLVCLIIIIINFLYCQSEVEDKLRWSGEIEVINGIKVIKNSNKSLYGKIDFELREDLSLGDEGNEDYLFHRIKDIAVDKSGNIYIVDSSNCRVQKFNQNGKYIKTIGRFGQGPGEFQHPFEVEIDDRTGNVFVKDGFNKIIIFDKNGRYQKTIYSLTAISNFVLGRDNKIIAICHGTSEDELTHFHELCSINFNGEIIKIFKRVPFTVFTRSLGPGQVVYVKSGYEMALHLAKLNDQHFIYGYSKEFILYVIDEKGDNLYQIEVDESLPQFTLEEKRRFRKVLLPDHKPYFFSIMVDSEKRIYVQENMATKMIRGYGPIETVNKVVKVFSDKGYFLFTTTLPPNTCVIREGYIYSYLLDEETGMEYVKRYKIINWREVSKRTNLEAGFHLSHGLQ